MARQQALEESIPAEWEGAAKDYQAKQKVLNTANRKYRRAMDDSFANVDEVIKLGDFTQLPDDLMMCGIALSLTESMDDDFSFED